MIQSKVIPRDFSLSGCVASPSTICMLVLRLHFLNDETDARSDHVRILFEDDHAIPFRTAVAHRRTPAQPEHHTFAPGAT